MTLSATRNHENDDRNVKVQITYGPVTASVVEDRGHLRGFVDQLGRLLDQMEAEASAKTTET